MRGLFITGTDTGVGKTVATGMIARDLCAAGHRTGCYKPVCSGSEPAVDGSRRWSDVEALSAAIGDAFPKGRICPQTFHAPLAPPAAAHREGREVDAALLREGARWWAGQVDVLLIEGVGGLLCPITADESVADLAVDLGFPLLIVSPLVLGTVNHTLMTIEVARHRGLQVSGILFNEVSRTAGGVSESSHTEIAARTTVPVLGTIPFLSNPESNRLRLFPDPVSIDWAQIAGRSSNFDGCREGTS
ncbi:MAG: dethiobiotin synthase [Planctomycetaceae bacterium]